MQHYILDENGNPKPAGTLEWAQWFETTNRLVEYDVIGNARVSTVFMGIGGFMYETMITGGGEGFDGWVWREETFTAAMENHAYAVKLLTTATGEQPERAETDDEPPNDEPIIAPPVFNRSPRTLEA